MENCTHNPSCQEEQCPICHRQEDDRAGNSADDIKEAVKPAEKNVCPCCRQKLKGQGRKIHVENCTHNPSQEEQCLIAIHKKMIGLVRTTTFY